MSQVLDKFSLLDHPLHVLLEFTWQELHHKVLFAGRVLHLNSHFHAPRAQRSHPLVPEQPRAQPSARVDNFQVASVPRLLFVAQRSLYGPKSNLVEFFLVHLFFRSGVSLVSRPPLPSPLRLATHRSLAHLLPHKVPTLHLLPARFGLPELHPLLQLIDDLRLAR